MADSPKLQIKDYFQLDAQEQKNWLAKMQKHIDACQQLMADIKAGKNV
jgi:hypothetical protein